jgi:hypothetical protein
VHAIYAAERRILVTSYALTTGSGIVEALLRAKQRGVDVIPLRSHATGAVMHFNVADFFIVQQLIY